MNAFVEPEFERFLEYLRDVRGFDFTGYKRSTLLRRVRKRMDEVGAGGFPAYREHLEANPDEFTALFNTILINVTGFWRDPDAWDALVKDHLPGLLAERGLGQPVRAWTAGCASGEETYTLVMARAERMGPEAYRERVKIYATDLDEHALGLARAAVYTEKDVESVPAELRERYFERSGRNLVFRYDLRRLVIFGRHDLLRDAPISHLDLLVSRNVLMYFNADAQARIVNRFHFALNADALLFLGQAEMIRSHGALFAPVDLKAHIFRKVPRADVRERLAAFRRPQRNEAQERLVHQLRLRDAALDAHPSAQIVVDANGALALATARARLMFGLTSDDLGRPLQDLTVSYRPVELRSRIEAALAERRPAVVTGVDFPAAEGNLAHFELHVVPLLDGDGGSLGAAVTFVDVAASHRLQLELEESNQALETAFEELQSTNEELETTNEELQSTIEELETTNEELQSTNEELETMNEELQSTNEELEAINDELQRRTVELHDVNAYTGAILSSLRAAVVVLDRGSEIRAWNRRAEELWGMRADEAQGQAFQNLDIGLPVGQLKGAVRACVEGRSEHEQLVLEAVNRRGRPIRCRVTCTPFAGADKEVRGAVLVMEEWKDGAAGDRG